MSQRQDLAVDDNRGLIEAPPTSIEDRMHAFATGDAPASLPPAEPASPEPEPEVEQDEKEVPADESEHPPSDDPPADTPEAEVQRFTVKVDGEPQEVELDELLKGYSRTADYTRKTQRLAEERKAFDADAQAVRSERERYADLLEQLEHAVTQSQPQEPDWAALRAKDPAEFAAQFAEHQAAKEKMRAVQEERARVAQQEAAEQQVTRAQALQAEQDRLFAAVPEWQDPDAAKKERADLLSYGQEAGFTQAELENVVDHRAVLMLRKAMLYDRLQSGKAAVQQKAKKTPTIAPGGAKKAKKPPAPGQVARDRLKKSGSVRDATAVFLERLQAGG